MVERAWPFLMLLIALVAAGCAVPMPTELPPEAPVDFSLAVLVPAGAAVPPVLPHARPGRFLLQADGTLHHDTSPQLNRLPDPTRVLGRRQVQELWLLTREVSWSDELSTPGLVVAGAAGQPCRISLTADGRRWSAEGRVGSQSPNGGEAAIDPLLRRLAELAWVPQEPWQRSRVPPRRYDFGPDPYARFRQ